MILEDIKWFYSHVLSRPGKSKIWPGIRVMLGNTVHSKRFACHKLVRVRGPRLQDEMRWSTFHAGSLHQAFQRRETSGEAKRAARRMGRVLSLPLPILLAARFASPLVSRRWNAWCRLPRWWTSHQTKRKLPVSLNVLRCALPSHFFTELENDAYCSEKSILPAQWSFSGRIGVKAGMGLCIA